MTRTDIDAPASAEDSETLKPAIDELHAKTEDAANTATQAGEGASSDGEDPPRSERATSIIRRRWTHFLRSTTGTAAAVAALCIVALLATCGWLWTGLHHADTTTQQRELFLSAGRGAALNLTTIRYTDVDADIQRILDGATGKFHDQFQSGAKAFADVVRNSQTTSTGNVADAGIESVDGDSARVLVSATVQTTASGQADQSPRRWRMRLTMEMVDQATAKVSNVEFVP